MVVIPARRLFKRSNLLVQTVRSVRGFCYKWRGWVRTNFEIVEKLAAFSPNSVGSLQDRGTLALQAAEQAFPLLTSLISTTSTPPVSPVPIASIFPHAVQDSSTAELASLFNRYGSDKSSFHDYHLLYGPMLALRRNEPLQLLEIGLGTNNPEIVSTMGISGKPGASLRAFRDFLPNAHIFGADIDKRVLFSDERIKTYFVDQTRKASFNDLALTLGSRRFDFIIDDGLHSPNANLATMIFALLILNKGGTFIVEDISADAIPVWQTVAALLPSAYMPMIIQAKNGFLFKITAAS
jgi:hypothetical protein